MEVILNDGLGESILLPPSVALDEYEINKQIPGVIMPGKSGQRVYKSLQRIEPVILKASGTMKFDTVEEADEHASILRSKLLSNEVMWLKRYDGADKFIRVQCNQINHNPHRGHFDGTVYSINFIFEANDPYWYSTDIKQISEDVEFTPPVTFLNVINGGEVFVEPIIWIEGKTSGANSTKNPKLVNYSTGDIIKWDITLKQDESISIDSANRRAYLFSSEHGENITTPYYLYEAQSFGGLQPINISSSINKEFLAWGFKLNPGLNKIEMEDDNNLLKIKMMFRERWL